MLSLRNLEGHSVNAIGGKLYIFGGCEKWEVTNTFMSIDMDHDYEIEHVQYKGNCPSERAFHGSITFGNKILVYGGFD
jgi:hypothetical protein